MSVFRDRNREQQRVHLEGSTRFLSASTPKRNVSYRGRHVSYRGRSLSRFLTNGSLRTHNRKRRKSLLGSSTPVCKFSYQISRTISVAHSCQRLEGENFTHKRQGALCCQSIPPKTSGTTGENSTPRASSTSTCSLRTFPLLGCLA